MTTDNSLHHDVCNEYSDMLEKYRQVACVILMPARCQTFGTIKCATSVRVFDEVWYTLHGMHVPRYGCVLVTHLCLLATVAVRVNASFKYYLTTLPTAQIT